MRAETCLAAPPPCASLEPTGDRARRYRMGAVSENFSLIVMCFFMLASLAFLAQQILAYH
jgi:hypothetical protein